ncbi:hypothetical protein BGX31_003464 [Mortierella sp. GBA43]|nr:hypothetical protein BGX31_003464 [Mortierella sp. GBA43]
MLNQYQTLVEIDRSRTTARVSANNKNADLLVHSIRRYIQPRCATFLYPRPRIAALEQAFLKELPKDIHGFRQDVGKFVEEFNSNVATKSEPLTIQAAAANPRPKDPKVATPEPFGGKRENCNRLVITYRQQWTSLPSNFDRLNEVVTPSMPLLKYVETIASLGLRFFHVPRSLFFVTPGPSRAELWQRSTRPKLMEVLRFIRFYGVENIRGDIPRFNSGPGTIRAFKAVPGKLPETTPRIGRTLNGTALSIRSCRLSEMGSDPTSDILFLSLGRYRNELGPLATLEVSSAKVKQVSRVCIKDITLTMTRILSRVFYLTHLQTDVDPGSLYFQMQEGYF